MVSQIPSCRFLDPRSGENDDIALQVRREYDRYLEIRDAVRKDMGRLRRCALLDLASDSGTREE